MSVLPHDIVSDAEIDRVHGNANFGSMSKRAVVNEGVTKYAFGYTGGYTQLTILLEHGLLRKPAPGSYYSGLTKKGLRYLRAIYSGRFADVVALAEALSPEVKDGQPTYDELRRVVRQSREFGVEGWTLTAKAADQAIEWIDFLEGVGAACPKISSFDEGLQLVWGVPNAPTRRYLSLGEDDEDGFVMKLDMHLPTPPEAK